ncbi:dihydrofolate reductase family protein [Streptomyces sp. NBC_00878]|uniref:dihydrofolate reductase family protein n=1 Tax=Streptomyces sp. NBC_00878 TaxID=2975854 RepID=UPI0022587FD0|nr:dihydrofolate reductase family protein [Streptomyces sp. NBC_00878]MCX4904228.1 dihydrofolate reductase family protein [Streptomyces sp. NBC_00878]
MGKLTLTAFVTLDGVHQAPGGPDEDRSGGFEYGGWSFPYDDEDFGQFVNEVFDRAGAFLLGRHTYEIFAGFWPKVTDPANPVAGKLNALPKYVASSSFTEAAWAGTTVISGDLGKEVTAIKENTEGELQVHGSAALAQSLFALDLVDTVHLLSFPVVLGTGRRLFAEGVVPTAFTHAGARVTSKGVAIHTYDLAGRPEYGTFELPEGSA